MFTDPWLKRWLPLLAARTQGMPVLEIGCGHGDDTAALVGAGLPVIAFDLSAVSVRIAKARVPSALIERRDIRAPFPPAAQELGVVVASLSLHYFPWDETVDIVRRIHAVLRPGGVLLCRLNSTEDRNFGAAEQLQAAPQDSSKGQPQRHPQIEPNYFLVNGEPKRFFDETSARSLFSQGWNVLSAEHFTTRKYIKPKALWEVVVERV
jgi:SAM-dependent methyltransferase